MATTAVHLATKLKKPKWIEYVLGLRGKRTALLGEARVQKDPMEASDLAALRAKLSRVPDPIDAPILALWGRAGVSRRARSAGVVGWSLREMLER